MLLRPGTRALALSRADLVLLPEGQWTGDLLSRTIARRSVDGALGRASLEVIPKTLFFHTQAIANSLQMLAGLTSANISKPSPYY